MLTDTLSCKSCGHFVIVKQSIVRKGFFAPDGSGHPPVIRYRLDCSYCDYYENFPGYETLTQATEALDRDKE